MRNVARLSFVFSLFVLLGFSSVVALQQKAFSNGTIPPIPPRTYYTLPADFPAITVTVPASSDGFLFLSNFRANACASNSYLLILQNSGEPVFYRRLPTCSTGADFKRQPSGLLTYYESISDTFFALDNTYSVVDSFVTGNGYTTDIHELQVLPNGHALLMSYPIVVVSNTNSVIPNGRPTATVISLVVQELDVAKNVVFEWDSLDYIPISDTDDVHLLSEPVDYVHGNAIELDTDGNLLLSNRHLNEITKISRQTGDIIWRLGGKRNQFVFTNDTRPFSHQHDIRRLPNGNITFYDNGNFLSPLYSRAVEYRLDEVNKTATLVREYRNTPDTFGGFMGNQQRLSNGNVLVGWGGTKPALTEFKADGSKAFELELPPGYFSYRAFRFPWQGYPTWPPTLVVVTTTQPALYYSWNGATEIVGYRVYGGVTEESATLVDTTFKVGFETSTLLEPQELASYCYFRVMPVNRLGNETAYSNVVFLDSPACHPPTPTVTPMPSGTPIPTSAESTPENTPLSTPTSTPTATDTPTATNTQTPVFTASSTDTPLPATNTPFVPSPLVDTPTPAIVTISPTPDFETTELATPTPTINRLYFPLVGD